MEDRYIRGQRKRHLVNIKAAIAILKQTLLNEVMEVGVRADSSLFVWI